MLLLHNRILIFFSIAAFIFGIAVAAEINITASFSILAALLLILLITLHQPIIKASQLQFVTVVMLTSLIVKVFSIFFFDGLMKNIVGMPFLSYKDDYVYDQISSEILNAWKTRGFGFYEEIRFSTGFYSGYPNFSALAKALFGDNYLAPRFLNVIFSVLTVPVAFATIKYLTENTRQAKLTTLLIALSPIFITYSSLQLKDTILIFFLATLILGTVKLFKKGLSFNSFSIIIFSMAGLLFFRAAILFAYLVAIFITVSLIRSGYKYKFKSILWVLLILMGFYFIWEFIYSTGLLSLTGDEYFESRFSGRGGQSAYQGQNDLSKLGVIAVAIAPILGVLSLFFPTPVYLDLEPLIKSVPYHYFALLGYYAILPMALVSMIFIIKNYRLQKIGLFIVSFLILYKLGQAGSKSIFDSRQSLPAIYMIYLLLAYFDLNFHGIKALWKRYYFPILTAMLLVMFFFSYFRYLLRN